LLPAPKKEEKPTHDLSQCTLRARSISTVSIRGINYKCHRSCRNEEERVTNSALVNIQEGFTEKVTFFTDP
jgi:hypothetical protein